MRNHVNSLLSRFRRNVRMPDEAVGVVEQGAATLSGVAIQLRYGPLEGLVRGMRLARSAKYPILLKFVQRMFMLADEYDGPTQTFTADLVFGSFLPQDQAGAITRVREAVDAGIISLETGVAMLIQAGVPIEDANEEIDRIQRRAFVAAGALADATGDAAAVRRFLLMSDQEAPPAPVVQEAPPVTPAPVPIGQTPPANA
jgi:hypothetical protein